MSLSQAVEDYLKVIYTMEMDGKATTSKIAEAMDISSASVTNMMKRLSEMGLVDHTSYKGVSLTETGQKVALEIIRHHRLLELYLSEVMDYSWDQVHDEAEKLEHHISEQFEDKMDELLGNPTHDPHGDPIPAKDGSLPITATSPLTEAKENTDYLIGRVKNQDPELLRYLEKIGLLPGTKITVLAVNPFNGPIELSVEGQKQSIGHEVSQQIFVTELSD